MLHQNLLKLLLVTILFSSHALVAEAKEDKGLDPGVHIDITGVHNQCHDGISSVMLNNQSVVKYRIIVLKRKEYDEKLIKVLEPHNWVWIGCADDGYTYSISELIKL
jgi:hypothetical protein